MRGRREIRMYNIPEANPRPDVCGKLYQPKPILSPTALVTLLEAGLNFRRGERQSRTDKSDSFPTTHPAALRQF